MYVYMYAGMCTGIYISMCIDLHQISVLSSSHAVASEDFDDAVFKYDFTCP